MLKKWKYRIAAACAFIPCCAAVCLFTSMDLNPVPAHESLSIPESPHRLPDTVQENQMIQAVLLYECIRPWQEIDLGGLQLIDGSFARRSLMLFRIEGMDDPAALKSVRIYQNSFQKVLDIHPYAFGNEIYVVAACDGEFSWNENTVVRLAVKNEGEELERISVPVKQSVLYGAESVMPGHFGNRKDDWWLRLTNEEDAVEEKDGDIVITRTIQLFGFGANPSIDPSSLQLILAEAIPYNTSVHITGHALTSSEHPVSLKTKTAGLKQLKIVVTLKESDLDRSKSATILEILNRSRVSLGDFVIPADDGYDSLQEE